MGETKIDNLSYSVSNPNSFRLHPPRTPTVLVLVSAMGKPRLLVVTDSYCPRWDGVARVLVSILPTLAEHFQVRLLCPDYSKHFPEGECPDIPGVTLVFSPLVPLIAWRGCRIPLLQPHVARAEVENADICFTHTLGENGQGGSGGPPPSSYLGSNPARSAATLGSAVLTFAQALGVPTCSFVHSEEWHVYGAQWRPFGERVVKLMTNKWAEVCQRKYAKSLHLIVPSATTQAALRDYGVAPSRGGDATVVNLGVDAKKFAPLGGREARSARKAELGFPADIPLVMFLGRCVRALGAACEGFYGVRSARFCRKRVAAAAAGGGSGGRQQRRAAAAAGGSSGGRQQRPLVVFARASVLRGLRARAVPTVRDSGAEGHASFFAPSSPRFCPLLPPKDTPPSSCALRSRPLQSEILPASSTGELARATRDRTLARATAPLTPPHPPRRPQVLAGKEAGHPGAGSRGAVGGGRGGAAPPRHRRGQAGGHPGEHPGGVSVGVRGAVRRLQSRRTDRRAGKVRVHGKGGGFVPSTCAAEHMCGRAHVRPSTCAAEHMCDPAGL
jgi:hypothetical protein